MRAALRVTLAACVCVVAATSAPPARADDPRVEASTDYDAASAAYDRADYATAAVRFARADERLPNPRALQLAMASALLASDAGLAMNLVERSEARAHSGAPDRAVTELTRNLRRRFERAAGRIRVSCPEEVSCRASLGGEAIDATRGRWVAPGEHVVDFETGPGAAPIARKVTVQAGETVQVALAGPRAAPGSPVGLVAPATTRDDARTTTPPRRAGLPPAFFWTGVAATGVAVGVSTVLTVVVANRHDDFVEGPSAQTAAAGDAAQTRARVAWAVSGAFALTTVVLGVLSDFGARDDAPSRSGRAGAARPSARCAVSVGPRGASLAGTFW